MKKNDQIKLSNVFLEFYEVLIHTLLSCRRLYPPGAFVTKKKYGLLIQICKHTEVERYIENIILSLESYLNNGSIEKLDFIVLKDCKVLDKLTTEINFNTSTVLDKFTYTANQIFKMEENFKVVLLNAMQTCLTFQNNKDEDRIWTVDVHTKLRNYLDKNQLKSVDDNFIWISKEKDNIDFDYIKGPNNLQNKFNKLNMGRETFSNKDNVDYVKGGRGRYHLQNNSSNNRKKRIFIDFDKDKYDDFDSPKNYFNRNKESQNKDSFSIDDFNEYVFNSQRKKSNRKKEIYSMDEYIDNLVIDSNKNNSADDKLFFASNQCCDNSQNSDIPQIRKCLSEDGICYESKRSNFPMNIEFLSDDDNTSLEINLVSSDENVVDDYHSNDYLGSNLKKTEPVLDKECFSSKVNQFNLHKSYFSQNKEQSHIDKYGNTSKMNIFSAKKNLFPDDQKFNNSFNENKKDQNINYPLAVDDSAYVCNKKYPIVNNNENSQNSNVSSLLFQEDLDLLKLSDNKDDIGNNEHNYLTNDIHNDDDDKNLTSCNIHEDNDSILENNNDGPTSFENLKNEFNVGYPSIIEEDDFEIIPLKSLASNFIKACLYFQDFSRTSKRN